MKILITILCLLFTTPVWAVDYCSDASVEGCWRFTEGSGTTVADSSPNTNTGTFKASGEPAWDATDVSFAVSGSAPNSAVFDGVNDYINAGSDASVDAIAEKTVVAWIKPTSGNLGDIMSKLYDAGYGQGWIFDITAANKLQLIEFFGSSWAAGKWLTDSAVTTGDWIHVAVTFDNSSSANNPLIYVNGSSVALTETETPSGTRQSDASGNLTIGGRMIFGDEATQGNLTEVAIFSRILSQEEIEEIYNYGLNGTRRFFQL